MMSKTLAGLLGLALCTSGAALAQTGAGKTTGTKSTEAAKSGAATHTDAATSKTADKGDKPAAAPGWFIIEEEWYVPLRKESLGSLLDAQYHYRRAEELMAAGELRKAASWCRLAESTASKDNKEALMTAVRDLDAVALDLEEGRVGSAAAFDKSIAKASHAMSHWHWFRAKDKYGKGDKRAAADELAMAAQHLQNAAAATKHKFDHEAMKRIEKVSHYSRSDIQREGKHLNNLEDDLTAVEKAVTGLKSAIEDTL